MQKRNGRGRASLRELDLRKLYTCAINDLSGVLEDGEFGALHRALSSSPETFRDIVDSLLLKSESTLAVGGGTRYIALRQLQALLKKNPDWYPIGSEVRKNAAYAKFELSELKCRLANKRLLHARREWSRTKRFRFYAKVVNTASLTVQAMLGPLDHDASREILEQCRFGSGAAFLHTSDFSHVYYKLEGRHTVTKEALPILREWMALSPRIHNLVKDQKLDVVEGNRLSFVPKDWDIDRTIAIEPSWNVLLQLGVNGHLTRRLKSFGLHLDDQTLGWSPAREGSISGAFATVDLSSASDSISTELVRWLVPGEWFSFLNSLRSKNYLHDGVWHPYAKFSSMGNGFTFPLESIIFYSLAKASATCLGMDASGLRVYGDDIVIPRQLYAVLVEVLRFCGFETNSKKSYALGHFRETCGRDFLQGVNVRPVYLRSKPRTVEEVYNLYNRLHTFSMVALPSTLDYLESLVKRAHYGPGLLSRSSLLESLAWDRKGQEYDKYFFSDPIYKPKWSADIQQQVYSYSYITKVGVKDRRATNEELRYLCFLYGIEGGIIYQTSQMKHVTRYRKCTWWPDKWEVRRYGLESRDL